MEKAQEHDLLKPMIEGVRKNFQEIGKEEDVFEKAKLLADSGYHTEKNMEMLAEEGIDAYVADNRFRKRDPRFADYEKYKDEARKTGPRENLNSFGRRTSPLTRTCAIASALPASDYTAAAPMRKRIGLRGRKRPAYPVRFEQNASGIRKKPSFVRWLILQAGQETALPLRIG